MAQKDNRLARYDRQTAKECVSWKAKNNRITIIKMSVKLTNNIDFILVELLTGMDYWEIIEGMAKLFSMPEFKNKNDIWVFASDQIKMAHTDLYKIKSLIKKNCPKDFKATKTAIVVKNDFQQTYAILYSDICKDWQHEIRVFTELESAKDWIAT